jgi:diguanylate cyclase (GGDEF)-like protein
VEESHAFSRNLLTSISTRLRNTNQMISSKSREDDTFYDYGMLDVLTGMHSRRWFDRIINRALRRSILDGKPFSILIADIDNFNSYNEQYGRMCGDLALNRIAHTIQEHLRVTELAVRYEGDRLMVLLPGTDIRKARKVAERLRLKVMYTDMPAPGGRMLHPLTISVGIAQATPEQTVDEFMDNVLTALKRAKDMGRNYVSE